MDHKEKDNYPELDCRPRSAEYPEVYYPPPVTPAVVMRLKNEDAVFASYSPVSELSSPATAFYGATTPSPIYQLEERPQRRKKMFSGFWLWVLVALLLVLAIVGGIVGGLLGARKNSDTAKKANEQGNTPNENATSPNPNATVTVPPKFASIATSKCFNETLVQVFYLDTGSLKGSVFDGEIWTDLNDLSPSIKPRISSPLAAVSWNLNGNTQIRIYYFDAKNREIELGGSCIGGGPPCTWTSATMLQASGISPNSSLTAVQWTDATTGIEVRTMWENNAGKLAGSVFTRGSWSPDIPFVDVMPGTPVAANVDSDTTPFTIRVWYRDPNGELEKVQYNSTDPGWKSPDPTITIGNTTTVNSYASIGVSFVPANASLETIISSSVFLIQDNKQPLDVSSSDNKATYTTSTDYLRVADDPGGAIAALGWSDPADGGLRSIRVYYAKNRKIQEMAQKGDVWSVGSVLGS